MLGLPSECIPNYTTQTCLLKNISVFGMHTGNLNMKLWLQQWCSGQTLHSLLTLEWHHSGQSIYFWETSQSTCNAKGAPLQHTIWPTFPRYGISFRWDKSLIIMHSYQIPFKSFVRNNSKVKLQLMLTLPISTTSWCMQFGWICLMMKLLMPMWMVYWLNLLMESLIGYFLISWLIQLIIPKSVFIILMCHLANACDFVI